MRPEFTAHNIRLDDGTYTISEQEDGFENHPWLKSATRLMNSLHPENRKSVRVADLGCLEGGYSVEFARSGYSVLGLEVRESNIQACEYVKSRTDLPRLEFVKDDAWNIDKHGRFDVMFCCGLFYHLDRPREFLQKLAEITDGLLILQTHFATDDDGGKEFPLTKLTKHEGLPGRWYTEFASEKDFKNREQAKWSSWDNRRSFWIKREHLIEEIYRSGFDLVFEQFDSLAPEIAESLTSGFYARKNRGTFIGIKSRQQI